MTTCRSLKYGVSSGTHFALAPSLALVATTTGLAGEIVGVLLALAEVDHRRRRRDQLGQSIRNFRSRRLAFDPLRAVPMELRELLLAGAVEVFPDQKVGLAVRVAVDVFGERGPLAIGLAVGFLFLRLDGGRPSLSRT